MQFYFSVGLKLAPRWVLGAKLSFLMDDLRGRLSQVAGAGQGQGRERESERERERGERERGGEGERERGRERGKARLDLICSTNTNCEIMSYRSFRSEKCSARGVRAATTWTAGLWQPSVHCDVAF